MVILTLENKLNSIINCSR